MRLPLGLVARQTVIGAALLTVLLLPVIWAAQSTPIIFDRFEYAVARTQTDKATAFRAAGWDNVKDGVNAWLYTVTSIPGYVGSFPGGGSRVLALEARPTVSQSQTDFYLQLGNENTVEKIPGNVWFQFWVYPQNHVASGQTSQHYNRGKFLYVTNGFYPSHSHKWMIETTCTSSNPLNLYLDTNCPGPQPWMNVRQTDGVSTIIYTGPGSENGRSDQLGYHSVAESLVVNRWTLIKMHFDTSTTSGHWEVWLQPQGGSFTKVANWHHGVGGLVWTIPAGSVGGHRTLRMPTTSGGTTAPFQDYWMYLDDFVVARAEADLPVYNGTTPPPPPPAACADGLDNDSDGFIDLADRGCTSASDTDEANVLPIGSAPTVTAVMPTTGPAAGGTSVVVTGTGFVSGMSVVFGSSAAVVQSVIGSTEARVVSPAGTGTVAVRVQNPDGQQGELAGAFSYTAQPPIVTVRVTTKSCILLAEELSGPPDATGGWGVQFRFHNTDGTFTNIGSRDTTPPYQRATGSKVVGTYTIGALWTKTGVVSVATPSVSHSCQ